MNWGNEEENSSCVNHFEETTGNHQLASSCAGGSRGDVGNASLPPIIFNNALRVWMNKICP